MTLNPFPGPPCFLADAMLGRLARWLRLLGFDTLYPGGHGPDQPPDGELLRLARAEGRLLLTRDRCLGNHEGTLLLYSDELQGQLEELGSALAAPFFRGLREGHTRCSLCNGELREVGPPGVQEAGDRDRNEVPAGQARATLDNAAWERIPPMVRSLHKLFWNCRGCGQLYWRGSHWERMEALRRRLLCRLELEALESAPES